MVLAYLIQIRHIRLYDFSVGAFIIGRKICDLQPGEKHSNLIILIIYIHDFFLLFFHIQIYHVKMFQYA